MKGGKRRNFERKKDWLRGGVFRFSFYDLSLFVHLLGLVKNGVFGTAVRSCYI